MSSDGQPTIVPGVSLAGVALGASAGDVTRVLGPPQEIKEFAEERAVFYSYQSLGLSFRLEHGRVVTGFAYAGRLGGYETGEFARFAGSTPEGIDLDTPHAEVLRLYGPPNSSGQLTHAPIPSVWIDYAARGVGFDFIKATGEMITLNISPPRDPAADDE